MYSCSVCLAVACIAARWSHTYAFLPTVRHQPTMRIVYAGDAARRLLGNRTLREKSLRASSVLSKANITTRASGLPVDPAAPPLKVHLFVDGTWLYYSMFGRGDRCVIKSTFGEKWVRDMVIMWDRLPIICAKAIREQIQKSTQMDRFVEVYRTTVFSSARADTNQDTQRARMFQDMQRMNLDVNLFTTTGDQEKCIDIALAVEMLFYATVPNAYDVAILLTGDKDFMPAMTRTRDKGKRVCLCSMRNGCNRDLIDRSHQISDFDVIWLDDYIKDFVMLKEDVNPSPVSRDVIANVIKGLLEGRGGRIGSRDLGRHLQEINIEGHNVLNVVKTYYNNLRFFLEAQPDMFDLNLSHGLSTNGPGSDPTRKEFMVVLKDSAHVHTPEAEDTTPQPSEVTGKPIASKTPFATEVELATRRGRLPPLPDLDLNSLKVADLKALLKSRYLETWGLKKDLIKRLKFSEHVEKIGLFEADEKEKLDSFYEKEYEENLDTLRERGLYTEEPEQRVQHEHKEEQTEKVDTDDIAGIIVAYLETQPQGEASSRDVGRHLTNRELDSAQPGARGTITALGRLKAEHRTLRAFLSKHPNLFTVGRMPPAVLGPISEFVVRLAGPRGEEQEVSQ